MRQPFEPEKKYFNLLLAGLALLFCALRLLTLWTAVEPVSNPEELLRGALAKEMLAGLQMPLFDYQHNPYEGGALVVAGLAAGLFSVFGSNLLVLKLVPLVFFSLPALILTAWFLKKYFGARHGLWAALLFVCAPPGFIAGSLFAMGFHTETVLLDAMIFAFFYRAMWKGGKSAHWAAFGFAAGVSFWFAHLSAAAFGACFLAWLILNRETFFSRKNAWALAGFTVGIVPWLLYNFFHRGADLQYAAAVFSDLAERLSELALRLPKLFLSGVPESFLFSDWGLPGRVWAYAYYAFLLFFTIVKFRRGRLLQREKRLPLYLLPLLFLAAYAATGFPAGGFESAVDARYFPPLHWALMLTASLGLASVKRWKFVFIFILLFGAAAHAPLVLREPPGRAAGYKGYSMYHLGNVVAGRYPADAKTGRFPAEDEAFFLRGLEDGRRKEITAGISENPETAEFKAQVYRGAGREYTSYWVWSPAGLRSQVSAPAVPDESMQDFYWGMGWGIREVIREDAARAKDWIERVPAEGREAAAEGYRRSAGTG